MDDFLMPIGTIEDLDAREAKRREFILKLLKPDLHYGRMSSGKIRLYDAGCQKLLEAFGLVPTYPDDRRVVEFDHTAETPATVTRWHSIATEPGAYKQDRQIADHPDRFRRIKVGDTWIFQEGKPEEIVSCGLYRYTVVCQLARRDGTIVGERMAVCSSLEPEYVEEPRKHEHVISSVAQIRALNRAITTALCIDGIFESSQGEESGRGRDVGVPSRPPYVFQVWQVPQRIWKGPYDSMWRKGPSDNQIGKVSGNKLKTIGAEHRAVVEDVILDACGIPEGMRNTMAACSIVIAVLEAAAVGRDLREAIVRECDRRIRASEPGEGKGR